MVPRKSNIVSCGQHQVVSEGSRLCDSLGRCLEVGNFPVAHATVGHTNMVAETSICRGNEQHNSTCHRTENWTKYGVRDLVLRSVASLRLPIENAAPFAANGRDVIALKNRGHSEIVVLPSQTRKSPKLPVGSQGSQWPHVAAVIIEPADGCDGPLSALMPNGAIWREAKLYNAMLPT